MPAGSDLKAKIICGKADDGQHTNRDAGIVAIERRRMGRAVRAARGTGTQPDEDAGLLFLDEGKVFGTGSIAKAQTMHQQSNGEHLLALQLACQPCEKVGQGMALFYHSDRCAAKEDQEDGTRAVDEALIDCLKHIPGRLTGRMTAALAE